MKYNTMHSVSEVLFAISTISVRLETQVLMFFSFRSGDKYEWACLGVYISSLPIILLNIYIVYI